MLYSLLENWCCIVYSVLEKYVGQYTEKGCKAVYWKRMLDSVQFKDVVQCTGKLMLYGVLKKGWLYSVLKRVFYSVLKKDFAQFTVKLMLYYCTVKWCCVVHCKYCCIVHRKYCWIVYCKIDNVLCTLDLVFYSVLLNFSKPMLKSVCTL